MRRAKFSHWVPPHSRGVSPTEHPTECARCGIQFVYVEGFWHHACGAQRPDRLVARIEPETFSRARLAKVLGVTPNTIWRWERDGKSPVRPHKNQRSGHVTYSANDVSTLKAWAEAVV